VAPGGGAESAGLLPSCPPAEPAVGHGRVAASTYTSTRARWRHVPPSGPRRPVTWRAHGWGATPRRG